MIETPQGLPALRQIRDAAQDALDICEPFENSLAGFDHPELVLEVYTVAAGYARAIVEHELVGLPQTVTFKDLLNGRGPASNRKADA